MVQGVVRSTSTSAPISGALVQTTGGSTQTDSTGSYRLTLLAGVYSVTASATGYLPQTQVGTVAPGSATPLDFALASASIGGVVLDSLTNLGIPNATVTLAPGGLTTVTDLTGTFTFASVNPGSYTVTASAIGYTPASQGVSALAGQKVNVTLKLNRALL